MTTQCQSSNCVETEDETGLENCGDNARFTIRNPEDGIEVNVCPDSLSIEVELRQEMWSVLHVQVSVLEDDEDDDNDEADVLLT